MSLESEFQEEALHTCRVLKRQHGYNPTYFLRMVSESGGVGATKRLLADTQPQEGLFTLYHLGKLDMSIEAMALNPKYTSLFTEAERTEARKRLRELNYVPSCAGGSMDEHDGD